MLKIYKSIVEAFKKLLKKKTIKINYERTLFSKKETKRYLKSLDETTAIANNSMRFRSTGKAN